MQSMWRGFLVLALLSLAASTAAAQDAEALMQRGVEARRAGDDQRARELFEQAYMVDPSDVALAQLGLAEQALGRWVQADAHLREALESDSEFIERNRASLEQALSTIQEHLGRLELLGGEGGAEVTVNGALRGTMPLDGPIAVATGDALVEVRMRGYHTFRRTVRVTAGRVARETVTLIHVEERAPEPEPPEPARAVDEPRARAVDSSSGDGATAIPFYIIGAGAAVLTLAAVSVGIGFAVSREQNATTFNGDACVAPGMTRDQVCPELVTAVANDETAYTAAFIVAGALGVTSIVFFIVGASVGGGSDDEATLDCGAGPGAIGIACGGRF